MSSATAAARPGFAMPRIPMWFVALALLVAISVGAIAGAAMARSTAQPAAATTPIVRHHNVFPTRATAPTVGDYRSVVANLAAAEEQHDFAAQYRFRQQLDRVLTPGMIGYIYKEHARLVAALGASERDSHAALITREIAKLCGPAAVKAQLDFCN